MNVHTLDSGQPGTITALMSGVHGNERAAIGILEELAQTLQVVRGKVYLVSQANPRAIAENVRQTEKNLNRCFHKSPQGSTYEDLRAQEIIGILAECDILLDLHNTLSTENSVPFLISEHPEWNGTFPVNTTVSGLDILHPGGSDGYMNSVGKVGLCLESGSIYDLEAAERVRRSVMSFLKKTGNIDGEPEKVIQQVHYDLQTIYHAKTSTISFIKPWKDFESVENDELVGHDGTVEIRAPYAGIIVFSYIPASAGEEVCVFGKRLDSH